MNDTLLVTILETFSAGDITELDFNDGKTHLVLRKNAVIPSAASMPGRIPPPPVGRRPAEAVQSPPEPASETELITSPIVATFYAAPTPDAPPFVTPGAAVKAGAPLCILEAMKMMNQLEAEFDCEIVAVKAGSGDLVEYGQPLFEVKRLGGNVAQPLDP
jgi:acetyl-CoA carboxylase biotin carboxyl carrier protein